MSGRYGKGYSRRGAPVLQTSFTIDKLFRENSNRPCAARSAGTLGKWGITSFTTIRNSGFSTETKYTGSKYSSLRKTQPQQTKVEPEQPKDETPKPKKFFKSRNTDEGSETKTSSAHLVGKEPEVSTYKKKKSEDVKKIAPKPRQSSPSSVHSDDEPYKPPIVLRIVKGTSCLVSGSGDSQGSSPSSTPTSPRTRSAASKSPTTRSTRRRSFQETCDTSPVSPRPKRTRKEVIKDPEIQNIISQLISDEEEENLYQSSDFKSTHMKEETFLPQSAASDDVSEDSIPLACTDFYLKRETSSNKENEEIKTEELNIPKDVEVEVEKDQIDLGEQKLLQGNELLEDTKLDINAAIESVMNSKPEQIVAPSPKQEEQESGSESEESQDANSSSAISSCAFTSTQDTGGLKIVFKKNNDSETKECVTPTEEIEKSYPVKKKSIFKSRTKDDSSTKRLALYKHNWSFDVGEPGATPVTQISKSSAYDLNEFEVGALTKITEESKDSKGQPVEDVAKIKCDKKDKDYYTVIRNVKKAHQIQESGEFQEFNDDVEYILDALRDNNPIGTRCLSAISLASKCMAPAFRMHVRAHGTVAKFFKALHDATKDPSLGLCTATVMFVLSQDRLNMDLDRDSLELMLNLLESDASHQNALNDCGMSSAQLIKNKQKVRELCEEIKSSGSAKHLNLDNITVGQLAMETLLSLTSKRAGEWFKEELRELGGLEHIVKTICDCNKALETYISQWTDPLLDKLRKIDRCLRVLENVTSQNEENQIYLLKFQDGILISTMFNLYKICNDEIALYPCTDPADKVSTGYVIREALLATLKVLINLTQDFNKKAFCEKLAIGRTGLVESSLHLLLQVPNYIPDEEKFDLCVLDLSLLINLVEQNEENRKIIMESKAPPDPENIIDRTRDQISAISALVELFFIHEKNAYEEEVKTDAILDGKKEETNEPQQTSSQKSKAEEVEETVAKLLQKAGNHMEHTFIGAYIVLLLGYIIMDNKTYEKTVRGFLPEGNFQSFIAVLEKFYNFMKMTASTVGSSQGNKATERVLNYLINVNKQIIKEEEPVKDEPKDYSISSLYSDLDASFS